jgi:hypothetical protein
MYFLLTNSESEENLTKVRRIWGDSTSLHEIDKDCRLFLSSETNSALYKDQQLVGIFQGYVGNTELSDQAKMVEHQSSFLRLIQERWPIPDSFTGSFAVAMIEMRNKTLTLANDTIGFYPIYYAFYGETYFVSSSLIAIGVLSSAPFDETGILQRLCYFDYCNFGTRTMLQGCSRLLPGELLGFNLNTGKLVRQEYDNDLYGNVGTPDTRQIKDLVAAYWSEVKNECKIATRGPSKIHVALSGGMDSRLTFCAVPHDKDIMCLTYGDTGFYETKIARQLACLRNADFRSFHDYSLLFPSYKVFEKYVCKTESLSVAAWLQILEQISDNNGESPILLGDMCESLVGRNIRKYSSQETGIKNYLSTVVLMKDFSFTQASSQNFAKWKSETLRKQLGRFDDSLLTHFSIPKRRFEEETTGDLEKLFDRIGSHALPYSELYDELYQWYTHARFPMSKQILLCQTAFNPLCPSMSTRLLRITSNLHPNLRLNYRFFHELFSGLKELRPFAKIPTSTAPFIPQTWPSSLKFLVWGLRSEADEILIRRMIKESNPQLRYSIMDSMNWAIIYQEESAFDNISSWFDKDFTGCKAKMLGAFINKRDLTSRPYWNFDIISTGSVNIELRTIHANRQSNSSSIVDLSA